MTVDIRHISYITRVVFSWRSSPSFTSDTFHRFDLHFYFGVLIQLISIIHFFNMAAFLCISRWFFSTTSLSTQLNQLVVNLNTMQRLCCILSLTLPHDQMTEQLQQTNPSLGTQSEATGWTGSRPVYLVSAEILFHHDQILTRCLLQSGATWQQPFNNQQSNYPLIAPPGGFSEVLHSKLFAQIHFMQLNWLFVESYVTVCVCVPRWAIKRWRSDLLRQWRCHQAASAGWSSGAVDAVNHVS